MEEKTYIEVNVEGADWKETMITFPARTVSDYKGRHTTDITATAYVSSEQIVSSSALKEEVQDELMCAIRYALNYMSNSERLDIFGYDSLYSILLNYDGHSIIRRVNDFKGYPASGKIYVGKRNGEEVECMVLGLDGDWVCYTEKDRKTYGATVDSFRADWEYTGVCKEKEVDAIYDALK